MGIEYEKVCKEVQDMICDQPAVAVAPAAYHLAKREAEAEADAQYLSYGGYAGYAAAPVVAPVAHAVAHSVQTTVKHACRTVVTEHCVDNPIVKHVPVEVEHCHTDHFSRPRPRRRCLPLRKVNRMSPNNSDN